MQGRPGQGQDPSHRPSGRRIAPLNGTGKQRSIPQRPPGMARINQPPVTPRIARPLREKPEPKKSRRLLLIVGSGLVVCALLACVSSYIFYNVFNGISASAGAATTATSFLDAISKQDYNLAYQSLGPAITLSLQKDQFTQQAQNVDKCDGTVKNYVEVQDSATSQGTSQSYSYTITRTKLAKTYQLRLTLQQDQYNAASWKVTDYSGNLGPGQSAPSCK